jgi:hypothetical protein
MERVTFGSVVSVDIPSLNIEGITAKVDTGAWSGALHCTRIREENGTLYFTPLGDKRYSTSTKDFEVRQVRSATGHTQDRYIIPLELHIEGKKYHCGLGLSNRSQMQREMLLGRKFLIENNILVDVALTIEDDYEAEKYL